MELEKLLDQSAKLKQKIDLINRCLRNISTLNGDVIKNYAEIQNEVRKLDKIFKDRTAIDAFFPSILDWLKDYKQNLKSKEATARKEFGNELEKEMSALGLNLEGHYPLLKAGIFHIEIDFSNWSAKIWYGPQQELLARCMLSPKVLGNKIQKFQETLGSNITKHDFQKILHTAYLSVVKGKYGEAVPINQMLEEVDKKIKVSNKERKTKYNRADFSIDLFRLLESFKSPSLIVATRAFTTKRQDFLWVPSNELGKGSIYSHLKYKEQINE
jgi:hypothetical protein